MTPNPSGDLVTCCRCAQHATFTREALCALCREDARAKPETKPTKPTKKGGVR